MRRAILGISVTLGLTLVPSVACSSAPADPGSAGSASNGATASGASSSGTAAASAPTKAGPDERAAVPSFRVRKIAKGYSHVWDVQSVGSEGWLFTERDSATLRLLHGGTARTVRFPNGKVWVSGETGLMSLAVDPRFADNRRFYTCSGWRTPTGHDVRVLAWKLSGDGRRAIAKGPLVTGFPTSSGRHGGCRLLIEKETGALFVGTGDAAVGTNPENLRSLGGKVLRLDRQTGKPWPDNPFISATNVKKRYVYNYGHRNVQGLAQRADGTLWSAEHGPDRDDEINQVLSGADYGWNPVPGYNESVPMTDQSLPGDQTDAAWSSGFPTLATSGAVWVYGEKWGSLRGTMAVAALKAGRIVFLRFDADGVFVRSRAPQALREFGRLRSLTLAANGDLLATTDNGSNDAILRITPTP
ncbi:MAG: PQQ-dependent sugar dehydrogenase [Nocardioidaceae bacterium]